MPSPSHYNCVIVCLTVLLIFGIVHHSGYFVDHSAMTVGERKNIENTDQLSYPWLDSRAAVNFVRKTVLSPSKLDYNLAKPNLQDYTQELNFPYIFEKYLKKKREGFFLEAGAFDGETFSNTLALEMHHGWTGILVEPSPKNYAELKKKNRKCHILNACLVNTAAPKVVNFADDAALAHLEGKLDAKAGNAKVTCISIGAVLHYLNVTHIDYAVLDTEGTEPEILASIPWEIVTIDMVQIECTHCEEGKGRDFERKRHFLKTFMDIKGYDEMEKVAYDYVYQRRAGKK